MKRRFFVVAGAAVVLRQGSMGGTEGRVDLQGGLQPGAADLGLPQVQFQQAHLDAQGRVIRVRRQFAGNQVAEAGIALFEFFHLGMQNFRLSFFALPMERLQK